MSQVYFHFKYLPDEKEPARFLGVFLLVLAGALGVTDTDFMRLTEKFTY